MCINVWERDAKSISLVSSSLRVAEPSSKILRTKCRLVTEDLLTITLIYCLATSRRVRGTYVYQARPNDLPSRFDKTRNKIHVTKHLID
jgi:hypothetical protein